MIGILVFVASISLLLATSRYAVARQPELDETPARPGEWGFRPADGSVSQVTPPGFSWRPQKNAGSYDLQCARDSGFGDVAYEASGVTFNVHCPPQTLPAGRWFWRFRSHDESGAVSDWSRGRAFTIESEANALPLPSREDLLARIPAGHPRLFVRPEQMPELRRRAETDLADKYEGLVAASEKLLENPPPTEEPPLYPEGTVRAERGVAGHLVAEPGVYDCRSERRGDPGLHPAAGRARGIRATRPEDPDGLRRMGPERGDGIQVQRRSRDALRVLFLTDVQLPQRYSDGGREEKVSAGDEDPGAGNEPTSESALPLASVRESRHPVLAFSG